MAGASRLIDKEGRFALVRQHAEQYFTSVRFFAQALRPAMGRAHALPIFAGSVDFV